MQLTWAHFSDVCVLCASNYVSKIFRLTICIRMPNIFDNMITILEKYSTNLEEIVDERTSQLREEQKKTEELLHQMLPV